MYKVLLAIGGSVVIAAAGWAAGHATHGPPPHSPPRHNRPHEHPPIHEHGAHMASTKRELETIDGIVTEQTTAPEGAIDGAKLGDGTWLHWPPHLAEQLGGLAEVGQEVSVKGYRQIGPDGNEVIEVFSLTNVLSKTTFQREMPPPDHHAASNCGPRHGRPHPPRPHGNAGGPPPRREPPPPTREERSSDSGSDEESVTKQRLQSMEHRLKRIEEQLGTLDDPAK